MSLKIVKLMKYKFLEFFYGLIELFSDNFITYHSRPKLSRNITDEPFQVNSPDSHKCAIVLNYAIFDLFNITSKKDSCDLTLSYTQTRHALSFRHSDDCNASRNACFWSQTPIYRV